MLGRLVAGSQMKTLFQAKGLWSISSHIYKRWLFVNDCTCWRGRSHSSSTKRLRQGVNYDIRRQRTSVDKGEAIAVLQMFDRQGTPVDSYTYVRVLQKVSNMKDLAVAKQVHDHIIQSGVAPNIYILCNLLKAYIDCGSLLCAREIFDKVSSKSIVSWNIMIGGYVQHGDFKVAYDLFLKMLQDNLEPNAITYVSILNACASPGALDLGKELHAHITNARLESHVRVGTALIKMYANCNSIEDARQIFHKVLNRSIISWNVMIGAYAENGFGDEAFELFLQMQQEGLDPNEITYLSILNSNASIGALNWVRAVHTQALKAGLESDVRVGSALVNMYAKCGVIETARQIFDRMGSRNIISWNVMIGAYAEAGRREEAFELFLRMQQEGVEQDAITYLSILNPSADAGALIWVTEVHAQALKTGLESDVRVANAFINMYAKCGSINDAVEFFERMDIRNVISWTIMIGGLAQHGYGYEALQLFERMKRDGVKPNEITFVGVLSACRHAGLLDEGRCYFLSLSQDYGMKPTLEHYNCMVDILGRAGYLDEAYKFIMDMPLEADSTTWGALLGACGNHGHVDLAERAAEMCLELEPKNASVYVTLSNIYAAAGMWDQVSLVRNMMKERGVRKVQGRSWIEVDKKVHSFVIGDRSHPQSKEIHAELMRLTKEMKSAGYVPDTRFVMHDMDEQQKEESLCFHSEKLAIAYGLMNTPPGAPVRIFKNLRVCSDCHNATKFISKIVGREIVARDANRFHHFKDGMCSCGEYW